jgi:hypothetical protein
LSKSEAGGEAAAAATTARLGASSIDATSVSKKLYTRAKTSSGEWSGLLFI